MAYAQKFITELVASNVAQTNPSASFTVPSGQVFRGIISMRGAVAASQPDLKISQGGTDRIYYGLQTAGLSAGATQTLNTGMIELQAGSWIAAASTSFQAASGSVYVYGSLYEKVT